MSEDPAQRRGPESITVTLNAWWCFVLMLATPLLVGALVCPDGLGRGLSEQAWCKLMPQAVALLVVIGFALIFRSGLSFSRTSYVRLTLVSYPAFLFLWVPLALILYPYVVHAMGKELAPQDSLTFLSSLDDTKMRILLIVMACVLAPLGEEIFFRGYLFRALELRVGTWAAILVSSALFGLLHGLPYALPITLLGLFFAWLRHRTGGVAAPILAHMLHNSVTVSVTLLWPDFLETVFDSVVG